MTDELESKAYDDLDTIATEARLALNKLANDDVEDAQEILTDIKNRAEGWESL